MTFLWRGLTGVSRAPASLRPASLRASAQAGAQGSRHKPAHRRSHARAKQKKPPARAGRRQNTPRKPPRRAWGARASVAADIARSREPWGPAGPRHMSYSSRGPSGPTGSPRETIGHYNSQGPTGGPSGPRPHIMWPQWALPPPARGKGLHSSPIPPWAWNGVGGDGKAPTPNMAHQDGSGYLANIAQDGLGHALQTHTHTRQPQDGFK